MTISTTIIKNTYTGNGSTDAFTYNFKITDSSQMKVYIRTTAPGAETFKTEATHYTVAGVGSNSGTVTFTSGNIPTSAQQVVLRRLTPKTQTTDYVENDPFGADSHETALDTLTAITQEIQEEVDRSFKVSKTNSITTSEFVDSASDRASLLLGFDSDGDLEATTGRVSSVSVSAVSAGGTPTVSYNSTTGALALGVVTGNTGATGPAGSGDMSDLTDDTSPQLGGDLDVNGQDITSASNADVDINPHGTGNVVLKTDLVSIGGGSEVGHISSNGAYDLKLSTNTDSNSGNITITDAANGAITLTPNGTGIVDIKGSMNPSISTTGKAVVFGF